MYRVLSVAVLLASFAAASAQAEPLVVCGDETVFVIDTSAAQGKLEKLWSWNAKECQQLPESLRKTFRTTDDCKPLDGGARILVSSSSGGCALVERPSGRVVWYAQVPNAHSLELLPRERIVVASSTHAQGNRLLLFDIARPNAPLWEGPLVSAHGVVWDEGRRRLWALGLTELQCYELQDWDTAKPALAMQATFKLPDESGHDLQPVPRSDDLVVTTGRHVYLFDRAQRQFRLHPALGNRDNVKSVQVHPATGQTAYIQASQQHWWTDAVGLLAPAGKITLPNERLYKARWLR